MKWGYKSVHFELKKEGLLGSGVLDESEIEQELNEFGQSGWELVTVLEVHDGIIVFFKQQLYSEEMSTVPYRQQEIDEQDDFEEDMEQEYSGQPYAEEEYVDSERADESSTVDDARLPTEDEGNKEALQESSTIGAIKIE